MKAIPISEDSEEIALSNRDRDVSEQPTVVTLDEQTHLLGKSSFQKRRSSSMMGGSFSRGTFSQSIQKLKSATMTVSLLEKPSDDRRASAFLAGWNVTNLIQGTGILGVPYAVRMGGWAAVAANALVAFLCCYTGKLLVEWCMKHPNVRRKRNACGSTTRRSEKPYGLDGATEL